jgi:hypothetical protein
MVCCLVPALIFFPDTLGARCGKTELVVVVPDFLLILFCCAIRRVDSPSAKGDSHVNGALRLVILPYNMSERELYL